MGPAVGFALGAGPTPGTLENEQRTLLQRPQGGATPTHGRRAADDSGDARARVHRPRSRPISSFMSSLEPAQILDTRASLHARATRYSFMNP